MFIITSNGTSYKKNVNNLNSKMIVVNDLNTININHMSYVLSNIGIEKLLIFSIDNDINNINIIKKNNGSPITYMEMNYKEFRKIINSDVKFLEYNKFSLYILRKGIYMDIKNLFSTIDGCPVNIGRGGSQKAHALSPLDLRLSIYIMAMFKFDSKLIEDQNAFHFLEKDRYLTHRGSAYINVNLK
jgi:hypothetical protein